MPEERARSGRLPHEDIEHLTDREILYRCYDLIVATSRESAETAGKVVAIDAKVNGLRFEVRQRTKSLRDSVSDIEEKVDESGSHELEEAKARATKLEEELKEARRYWVRWSVGIGVGVIVAVALALVSYSLGKKAGNNHVRSLDRVAQQP